MVRVRVLFLEPGNKVHPSYLDDCITDVMMQDNPRRDWGPEDWEAEGYLKLCKEELVEGLLHSPPFDSFLGSSPNDPVMEVIKPITAVYFDLLELNANWESGHGQVGYSIEEIGLWEVFGKYVPELIEYAKLLTPRRNASVTAWGTKVQFLTMWDCWSYQDYWGEWDSGEDLEGIIVDHKTVKVKDAILQASKALPPVPSDPLKLD